MDKTSKMELDILVDESVQSHGILGTIYYSDIMEIETDPDFETSTDTNASSSHHDTEDGVLISEIDKDSQLQRCSNDAKINEVKSREADRSFQLGELSINTNVDEVNTREIDTEIQIGECLVAGNTSVSHNSISQNNLTTALAIASEEYRFPVIKFSDLLKVREKSNKERIEFCIELGLIASKFICPKCDIVMTLAKKTEIRDGYVWLCRGYGAKSHQTKSVSKSVRTGSIFSTSKRGLLDTLMVIHCWVYKLPRVWTVLELDIHKCTLAEWSDFCRDVCVEICARDCNKIGGTKTIVEIEGGDYERMKNDENIKKNSFVFIGSEDMYGGKTFLRIVEKCDKNSFLEVIKSSVLAGSTIISKFCSEFKCRKDLDFVDLAKSSKYKFKDPNSSDLSNRKSFWDVIRRKLPRHKKCNGFDNFIAEYLWRKRNSCAYDKMRRFLLHIKTIYPPPTIDG